MIPKELKEEIAKAIANVLSNATADEPMELNEEFAAYFEQAEDLPDSTFSGIEVVVVDHSGDGGYSGKIKLEDLIRVIK